MELVHLLELPIGVVGPGEGIVALPFRALYLGADLFRGARRFLLPFNRSPLCEAAGKRWR